MEAVNVVVLCGSMTTAAVLQASFCSFSFRCKLRGTKDFVCEGKKGSPPSPSLSCVRILVFAILLRVSKLEVLAGVPFVGTRGGQLVGPLFALTHKPQRLDLKSCNPKSQQLTRTASPTPRPHLLTTSRPTTCGRAAPPEAERALPISTIIGVEALVPWRMDDSALCPPRDLKQWRWFKYQVGLVASDGVLLVRVSVAKASILASTMPRPPSRHSVSVNGPDASDPSRATSCRPGEKIIPNDILNPVNAGEDCNYQTPSIGIFR